MTTIIITLEEFGPGVELLVKIQGDQKSTKLEREYAVILRDKMISDAEAAAKSLGGFGVIRDFGNVGN